MFAEYPHPIFRTFTGLVAGVRPSIAWHVGLDKPGIDLLDTDGQTGWRIGCQRLLTQLDERETEFHGADRAAAKALQRWLRYDLMLEANRWQTPLVLIEHLVSVAMAPVNNEPLMRHDMFVEAWTRNLRTAATSQADRTWRMPNRLSGTVALIIGELAGDRTAHELTGLLLNVICAAESTGGQPGEQLIGIEFLPELSTVLRHTQTARTRPATPAWPRENV